MEDVLEVYARPYDPKRPVVCVDEGAKELRSTPRGSLPMTPKVSEMVTGEPERQDYEYERHGKANLFMSVEPLTGQRRVRVSQRRTSIDFAQELRILVDIDYADTECLVLVTDNLKPQCRLSVRGVPSTGGTSHCQPDRVALHARAWLVAQHCRVRTVGAGASVPQPQDRGQGNAGAGSYRLGEDAQHRGDSH